MGHTFLVHGCIGPKVLGIFQSSDRKGRRKEDIRRPMRFFSYVLLVLAVSQVNHGLLPGNSTAVVLPSSYEKAHSDEHAR